MSQETGELVVYQSIHGRIPFNDWMMRIKDPRARAIVRRHLRKLSVEGIGKRRYVGGAVFEIKIRYGPGYRLYYGYGKNKRIILLSGGDKSEQKRDIIQAQFYLEDYKRRS